MDDITFIVSGSKAEWQAAFAEQPAPTAAELAAEQRGYQRGVEDAAKVCEEQRERFLSPQFATGQPLSSLGERIACTIVAKEIRALGSKPHD